MEALLDISRKKLANLEPSLQREDANRVRRISEKLQDLMQYVYHTDWERKADGNLESWLKELEGIIYSLDERVDKWHLRRNSSGGLVQKFTKQNVGPILQIASRVEDIYSRMEELNLVRRSNYYCPVMTPSDDTPSASHSSDEIRREEVKRLEELLLQNQTPLILVTGEAGIGKSKVVSMACDRVRHFKSNPWVRASEAASAMEVLKANWRAQTESTGDIVDHDLMVKFFKSLIEKRNLLVFDDVEQISIVVGILKFLPPVCAGKIVCITRDQSAPSNYDQSGRIGVLPLRILSREDARVLFHAKTSLDPRTRRSLESVAEEIIARCGGSPLGITLISGLLSTKGTDPSEWRQVLEQLSSLPAQTPNFNTFVLMGYLDLPPLLKTCFLYTCFLYQDDYEISKRELIRTWLALGFLIQEELPGGSNATATAEEAAEWLFKQLIKRNMFESATFGDTGDVEACRVLAPMRSFALGISADINFSLMFSKDDDRQGRARISNDLHRVSKTDRRISQVEIEGKSKILKSFIVWKANNNVNFSTANLFSKFKLLRVLKLQGNCIKDLPSDALGELLLLTYLRLRGTGIKDLPESLKNLRNLETLDVRNTGVTRLPGKCKSLPKLRHLLLAKSCATEVVEIPKEFLFQSTELQTVAGLKMPQDGANEIRCLTKLRKFSVGAVRGEHSDDLCKSINGMTRLQSLAIKWSPFQKLHIQPPLPQINSLVKLKLGGCINQLLEQWVRSLDSIVSLSLWDCKLNQDPLSAFHTLPNLVRLILHNAYNGKEILPVCSGFLKLEHMSILGCKELERWGSIETGAMNMLKSLTIGNCPKLKRPPQGLENLQGLLEVSIGSDMHPDFKTAVECHRSQRYSVHVIQDFANI